MHLGFNLANEEFIKFAHLYAHAPDMKFSLARAAKLGFSPRIIVDVGAFEGEWTTMAQDIWPDANIIMIEPNRSKTDRLKVIAADLNATLITELLGATDGEEVTFVVMESGSSVFEERSAVPRKRETRQLRTLDKVLESLPSIDLLKIDAQGYELEILSGATRLLPSIQAVILEVSLIEINHGAPLDG